MMKNRAGLLALLVLAIATVIMVFFVMPRLTGENSPLSEAVNKASDTVKDAAKTATETAGDVAKTVAETANKAVDQTSNVLNGDAGKLVLEKMGRLQADAKAATEELQALYADGKTPSAEALAAARARAVAAYDALKALKLPEGLDASVAASLAAAEEQASKALELVKNLPADAAAAGAAMPGIDQAAKAVEAATQTAGGLMADSTSAATAGIGDLKAGATSALADLKALFADGKVPAPEVLSSAKARAQVALNALKNAKLPEGADDALKAATTAATDFATRALAVIDNLPADATAAGTALTGLDGMMASLMAAPAATSEPAAPAAVAGANVPAFDIVRVEQDGSMVIAGRAKPDSKVEIVNDDTVIATTTSDAGGNFVAVLDVPLAPGDYQIVLRVTGKDGVTTQSEEVATISVPKDKSGQLLAMVTKAGAASRILTAPVEAPVAMPAGKAAAPVVADAAVKEPVKAADTAATDRKAPDADAAAVSAEVRVSAVELEGDKIFVAGTARPGSTVRIYADDLLIGELKVDADGNFVVDGKMTLSVGDHTIRADVMDSSGAVAFRATVPFNRPEGDQVAVVAPPANTGSAPAALAQLGDGEFDRIRNEASKAVALLQGLFADGKIPSAEELAAARSATEIALKSLSEFKLADPADDATLAMVAKAADAARTALEALKALPQDAATVGSNITQIAASVQAALAPAMVSTGGAVKPAPAETASKVQTPAAPAGNAAQPGTAVATSEPAKPAEGAGQPQPAAPKSVEQAPLEQSKSSVIIRRGDTLWQISRRVYGKGIRYTTIYLANEDQITDPDRIRPGQVFGVPEKAQDDVDAEKVHREHLKQ